MEFTFWPPRISSRRSWPRRLREDAQTRVAVARMTLRGTETEGVKKPPRLIAPTAANATATTSASCTCHPSSEGRSSRLPRSSTWLEMVDPGVSPKDGVTGYAWDRTQEPVCAVGGWRRDHLPQRPGAAEGLSRADGPAPNQCAGRPGFALAVGPAHNAWGLSCQADRAACVPLRAAVQPEPTVP